MSKKDGVASVEGIARRKLCRDRRTGDDRRNLERLRVVSYDCRSGHPRRAADVGGALADGDIWWHKADSKKKNL